MEVFNYKLVITHLGWMFFNTSHRARVQPEWYPKKVELVAYLLH